MSIHSPIKYVAQQQVDKKKWDACIERSSNGLIYGYSFYLDSMAKHWDALVLNDYEAVMPLTWNRKWGIKYLYQPPLTSQLGIFSATTISEKMTGLFLQQVTSRFRFAEIFFNYNNYHPVFKSCCNYILALKTPYDALRLAYKKNLLRNLKKAGQFELSYTSNFDLRKALSHHQQQYGEKTPHVLHQDYAHFEKLCLQLSRTGEVVTRAVFDKENNLLAVAVLLLKKNRLYLVEPTTFERGRKMQANHFLIDAIIQEFSEKDMILDMVGSDIPGVAQFYKNFGCIDQPYYFYYFNRLPWPLHLLK